MTLQIIPSTISYCDFAYLLIDLAFMLCSRVLTSSELSKLLIVLQFASDNLGQ